MQFDINGIKYVLFDLDGTLYEGENAIEGAAEVVDSVRKSGRSAYFVTNNSVKTRSEISEKLNKMGIACSVDDVFTAGHASALYAKHHNHDNVFVCGSEGLRREFEEAGIHLVGADDCDVLFIGYDPDFNYEKCTDAVRAAMRAEMLFACNKERVFRGAGGKLFPGCGAMAAPIEWCASKQITALVGKPNTNLLATFCFEHSAEPGCVLMVGDTYESDVLMAYNFGSHAVLVREKGHGDVDCFDSVADLVFIFNTNRYQEREER